MDDGLHVGVRHVQSEPLRNFQEVVGALLLGVKNKNPDGDKQTVDGEGNHSRRPPQTRSKRGRKCEPIFAAVEKNRQRPGQHDTEQGDDADENAEHAGLERGTNRNSPVQVASEGRSLPGLGGNLKPTIVGHGIQARANSSIRDRNLHVDLRSAALRTKRPSVLDRGAALLARVLHIIEASAQPIGEQPGRFDGSDGRARPLASAAKPESLRAVLRVLGG
jgi:hypothetical protein